MYYIVLFHWMSRRFIPFVVKLWSNDPDKWLFSPGQVTSRNFDFHQSKLRFLFARIIYKEDLSTMSMNHRCFFILDRIVWPLTTFTDRPEDSFRSSAFQRLFFRSSGFKICQPMPKLYTASCLTVWAFLLEMNGLTKKAECSSSSRLRMSRGFCVAQTTKRPDCSGNLKNLVWLNENVEGKESHVWCIWKTFRQNLQRKVSRIVIMTILVALKSLVKTR